MPCKKHRWSMEVLEHKPSVCLEPGSTNLLYPMHYRVEICVVCFKIKGVPMKGNKNG